jgi:hypothetical protein
VLLLQGHFVETFTLALFHQDVVNAEVASAKVVPSTFSIQLVELRTEALWWLVVLNLVHAEVVGGVHLVHVLLVNVNVLKHYVVLLESFVEELLSCVPSWWIVELALLHPELGFTFV